MVGVPYLTRGWAGFDEQLKREGAKNELLSLLEGTEGNSVTFYSLVTEII